MDTAAAVPGAKIDRLSWSRIQTYLGCPRRFCFRYVEQAPEERRSASLVFGGSIHRAIERVQEARIAGESLPSTKALLHAYAAAWREESRESPELHFAAGEDAGVLRELAGRMLTAYREHVAQNPSKTKVLAIEHEADCRIAPDLPLLRARLDLVEVSERKRELYITDYKTSRCSWNEQKLKEALPQIVIYAHAAMDLVRALRIKRVVPRFVILTKGKTPKVQVLEPKACQDDVAKLRRLVSDVWSAIQKEAFVKHESWQCKSCPYRDRCQREG